MKRRDPEATRQAILEAAEQVFAERGFGETSTSTLARRAGVTKSLIHHHFGSKEGLWEALKQQEFGTYHDAQSAMLDAPTAPNLDVLLDSVRVYFNFLAQRPRFARILTWMQLERDESCQQMGVDLFAKGIERLRHGQAEGYIRADVRPESILLSLFGLVEHWFLAGEQMGGGAAAAVGDAGYLDDIVKIMAHGVAGPAARADDAAGPDAPAPDASAADPSP